MKNQVATQTKYIIFIFIALSISNYYELPFDLYNNLIQFDFDLHFDHCYNTHNCYSI